MTCWKPGRAGERRARGRSPCTAGEWKKLGMDLHYFSVIPLLEHFLCHIQIQLLVLGARHLVKIGRDAKYPEMTVICIIITYSVEELYQGNSGHS